MALRTLATATTDEVAEGSQVQFSVPTSAFSPRGSKPTITAQGLAAAETLTIHKWDGTGYQALENGDLVFGTNGSVSLESAGIYGFIKSATASAINIILDDGR